MLVSKVVVFVIALFFLHFRSCVGTWSILLANVNTGEVGVASVTCVSDIDLKTVLPVVVPGVGVAAVQAFADLDGIRRPIIRDGLLNGKSPQQILEDLEARTDSVSSTVQGSDEQKAAELIETALNDRSDRHLSGEELKELVLKIKGHQFRQYGIVDVNPSNSALTFTGSKCVQYAGGMTGTVGYLKYAIQGNMLAGDCVLERLEMYLKKAGAHVQIPDLLFYALKIGESLGGDGRCSCNPSSDKITSCGCPVPKDSFEKAGHVGFLLAAKKDDTLGVACDAKNGCATGDYYLEFDTGPRGSDDESPVTILEKQFKEWKMSEMRRLKTEL